MDYIQTKTKLRNTAYTCIISGITLDGLYKTLCLADNNRLKSFNYPSLNYVHMDNPQYKQMIRRHDIRELNLVEFF